jgi:peptidoglycan/LPS O-acetylase OafA/YrhL
MKIFVLPATIVGAVAWDFPAVRQVVEGVAGQGIAYNLDLIDRLWTLFALGIAAFIFRERLYLSWAVLALLLVANIAAHQIGAGVHVRALFIGYAVLCFGFLTARRGAVSGAWPDYSYGMYIYAFPVMLVVHAALPSDSYMLLALLNLLATLPIAVLSWHYLEKPALDLFRRSRSKLVPSPLAQP